MKLIRERRKMLVLAIVLIVVAGGLYIGLLSDLANNGVKITKGYRTFEDAQYVGKANPDQEIWITIALKWQHERELDKFLGQVNDVRSPMYHKYMNYEVFKNNFAPSEEIYGEMLQWLHANNIHVEETYALRNAITIHDTIGKISKLFGIKMGEYRSDNPHYKSEFFAAMSAPRVPAKFAPYIYAITGLDNATKFHLNYFHASSGTDYLSGADVARMYHVYQLYNNSASGAASSHHIFATGLRVATVLWEGDAAPFDPDAVTYYYKHVIPSWIQNLGVMSTVHGHGMSGTHQPGPNTDGYVSGENELDLEMVGTLAPGVDAFCVYGSGDSQGHPTENNFPDNEYNYILNTLANDNSKILVAVSNSWGGGDASGSAATDNAVKALNAMGVTVLASSGDDGDTDSPSYPSTDAHDIYGFIAVGGTTPFPNGNDITSLNDAATMGYNVNLANPRSNEVVWYDSTQTGAGGNQAHHWGTQSGISSSYGISYWQKNYVGSYSGRVTADISAMGNHTLVYVSKQGSTQWSAIAGTSVACPVVAGMVAEMAAYVGVQYRVSNHGLGYLLPTIYKLGYDYYHNGKYSNNPPFYDVTETPSGYHNGETQYWAKTGWDPASGWGVINAWEFIHDIGFTLSASSTSASVNAGDSATYYISAKFPYDWTTEVGHFVVTGLPSGATYSFSPNYVHPTGNGATAGTTLTIHTTSSVANGDYTITVKAYTYNHTTGHWGNLSSSITLHLEIGSANSGNSSGYLKGVDVSHWQGDIDWTKVYNAGYRFAYVKATEGTSYTDSKFTQNINNGYSAGMMMGAYHFAHPDSNSAVSEADHFVNVISPYLNKMQLPPALDLEDGSSLGKSSLSQWVNTFMNEVKQKTGITPVIYTNTNYASHYLDSSVTQWPLWIAHWTYDPNTQPNTGVWSDWTFWQYSDKGSVPGISGNVDLDLYKGSSSGGNSPDYLKGIDVSHYQGDINWNSVYNAGYRFAYVKATEGTSYTDSKFSQNINNGYVAGMLMGAYHVAHPSSNSAVSEADHFVDVISPYLNKMQLPPALALVSGSSMGKSALSQWVNTFMNEVKQKTGITPVIYTSKDYAANYLDPSVTQWPLWIKDWTYDISHSPETGVWGDWTFWQYSDSGSVPGISGNVPLDVYHGSSYNGSSGGSVPSAPLNLQATAGDGYVKLTWNAPSNNGGAAITGYKIYRGTNSGGESYLTTVTGTSYTDNSVTNGVTYYYYVTAVNSNGESAKSNEVSATPHGNQPTNKILLVDGDGGKDYQTYFTQALSDAGFSYDVWDTSSKGVPSAGDLENYRVVIWTTGSMWQNTLTTDEQNALITYLNNGGKLYLSSQDLLWDLSGGNDGTISNTFVNDYLKVTAVKNDKAYEEVNGVSGDPISGGLSTISLNYPFYNYADEITVGSGASVIFTDSSGAATADCYDSGTFRVVFTAFSFEAVEKGNSNTGAALIKNIIDWLLNGGGSSGPSKPSPPLNLQATAGDGYVQLTWNAPTSNGGAAITGYKVYRGTSSGGESYLSTVSGTSYTDKSVSNGVTYYYYVTAVNSAGESGKSNEVSATPQTSGVHSNKILFVDDDEGSVYSEYVEKALIDSGLTNIYHVYEWDVYKIGYSPTFDDLKDYAVVIWSTGYAYKNTLTSEDQNNLMKYLNSGGRLYLSSQDFLWEITNGNDGKFNNVFVNDYLGVTGVNNDISYTYVKGMAGDPIGGDFGTVYLSYPFDNYADEIGVEPGAHAIFYDKYGYATGVRYAHGNYKVVFTAFSFEAVEKYDSDTGATLMYDIVSWLLS